eukprot:11331987-Alexandrium_andersonii.AAC.1
MLLRPPPAVHACAPPPLACLCLAAPASTAEQRHESPSFHTASEGSKSASPGAQQICKRSELQAHPQTKRH